MYRVYIRETSGASFSEITDYVSRDSLQISDAIQEKANTIKFGMESNPVSEANEVKVFDATELTDTSSVVELIVSDLDYEVNKFRVGKYLRLDINGNEEKLEIKSIDTVSKKITIDTASQVYGIGTIVGVKKFAGHINKVTDRNLHQLKNVVYTVQGIDYTKEFSRKLINDSWVGKNSAEIIDEFVREFVNVGLTSKYTTASVEASGTFDKFRSAFKSSMEVMQRLAEESGNFSWWIDYDKDIHFKSFETEIAPIRLNSSSNNFYDLKIDVDLAKVKNKQVILGGLEDSDSFTNEFHKGDGAKREWVLRAKFSSLSIEVGANSGSMSSVSVLPDNINEEGSADYFSNFTMQSVRAAETTSVLTTASLIKFTYKEKVPINVLDEEPVSISALKGLGFGDGIIEGRAIVDKSIETRNEAEDIARAELLKYSNAIIKAQFVTEQQGLKSGQSIRINDSNRNLNQDFLIQNINEKVYAGDKSKYSVTCASTLFGINELIQKLLKADTKIQLDTDIGIDLLKLMYEKIDLTSSWEVQDFTGMTETISLTSSLISSNIIPPFLWGATTSVKAGRWNLSSWR